MTTCHTIDTGLGDTAGESARVSRATKRKRANVTGIDQNPTRRVTKKETSPTRATPPRQSDRRRRAQGCPWTDAVEAPAVWARVVKFMLAKVAALDRSGFGDRAEKECWRMACTLALLGSTCVSSTTASAASRCAVTCSWASTPTTRRRPSTTRRPISCGARSPARRRHPARRARHRRQSLSPHVSSHVL
ncbi:hypothetical protein pclt_cds_1167 [Pandoravirus celtis]|uniref:Uncharacterized protein n=1 Tax=Pandoravirus celtis TaxID=2568002 RepID=A0A4D6EJT2_9VIRU|nr:hypothetical protein pclt_cds_1167 [Pandoravirus celtis]